MDKSTVKKVTFVPSVIVSVFLLGMTLGSPKVDASPVNTSVQGTQLAWWVGGSGWCGGGCGYNRCGYGGCGFNYGCRDRCWRGRWGRVRCGTSCWF